MYKHYSGLSTLSPTTTTERKQLDPMDSPTGHDNVGRETVSRTTYPARHLSSGRRTDRTSVQRKTHRPSCINVIFGCSNIMQYLVAYIKCLCQVFYQPDPNLHHYRTTINQHLIFASRCTLNYFLSRLYLCSIYHTSISVWNESATKQIHLMDQLKHFLFRVWDYCYISNHNGF